MFIKLWLNISSTVCLSPESDEWVMDQTCYSSLSGFTDESRLSSDDSDLILLIEFDFLSLWRSDSAELGVIIWSSQRRFSAVIRFAVWQEATMWSEPNVGNCVTPLGSVSQILLAAPWRRLIHINGVKMLRVGIKLVSLDWCLMLHESQCLWLQDSLSKHRSPTL